MFTDIETIVFSMFFLFFAVWTFFASPFKRICLYSAFLKSELFCRFVSHFIFKDLTCGVHWKFRRTGDSSVSYPVLPAQLYMKRKSQSVKIQKMTAYQNTPYLLWGCMSNNTGMGRHFSNRHTHVLPHRKNITS